MLPANEGDDMTDAHESDLVFAGSVPELYDRYLVPLIFEPYAEDVAARVAALDASAVLEVAAGTGAVTRALAAQLPGHVAITATDLNQPMLDHAMSVGTARPVEWQRADVMTLPFADGRFDVVVCQFGAMFFPDRPAAFAEVARVLRPGGTFIFNVWDRIETNEFADVITNAMTSLFPDDPPRFLARTPHGYHDGPTIRADVAAGGFALPIDLEALEARSRAESSEIPAIAYCQGTPLRNELEAREGFGLQQATAVAATAIGEVFGQNDVDGLIRAHVITAKKA
jgi:SAM-dependent methyltransferase